MRAAGWLTRVVSDHLHVDNVAAGGNQVGLQAITAALQGEDACRQRLELASPAVLSELRSGTSSCRAPAQATVLTRSSPSARWRRRP